MPEFDKEAVRYFLRGFKEVAASRGIYFVKREKTDKTLIELGLTRLNCKDEIMSLSILDYCSGPDPDFSRTGREHFWIFGKVIKGKKYTSSSKPFGMKSVIQQYVFPFT